MSSNRSKASSTKPKTTKATSTKSTPKPAPSAHEQIQKLFRSLCAQIDGGHFSNALKTCDKILRLDPKDPDALQTKVFLLLQTEQYESALAILSTDDSIFERAYTLYRLHREPEAKEILGKTSPGAMEEDRGILHLQAQLSYREGQFQSCVDVYNELLDSAPPDSEEQSDIQTNLLAAQRQLDFINSNPALNIPDIENQPPPTVPASNVSVLPADTVVASAKPAQPAEKKVRMKRVPKGITPGVSPAPDPERWLKKSERSTFNTGRRRKGGAGGGATQGSAVENTPTPAKSGGGGGKGKKRK